MRDSDPTACVLIIGNEILSGRTKDTNSGWIADRLTLLGIRLQEIRVIPDVEATIVSVVNEVRARYTYVFTCGGIGPTHDDITAESIAKAFGVPWELNEEARAILRSNYSRDEDLTPARLRMAMIPRGAELVANPISKAPGFRTGNVYTFAGVPRIMQAMFEGVAPHLKRGNVLLSHTIVGNVAEGRIGDPLAALQRCYADIEIGSYPGQRADGTFRNSVVLRGTDRERLAAAAREVKDLIQSLGGEAVDEPPQ
ncbi:competence/damage-inducible protein A [Sphingomonas daechungensis]|uniref:competence/damage-inducible protein A n=1 Tax=Sphingomonas daechungensis TaxID=1176646 RepID=UPI00378313E4